MLQAVTGVTINLSSIKFQLLMHVGVTTSTYVVVLTAGLLTSLSPCTLSVLPLTIGYIGGYSADKPSTNSILIGR